MDVQKQFSENLELLGQMPSKASREHAVAAVFAALKSRMSSEQVRMVEAILPSWLRSTWTENGVQSEEAAQGDVVELIKRCGHYAYRGAAERVLQAVFTSLIEALDKPAQQVLGRSLPEEFLLFWDRAGACSLGETMGEYL